MLKYRRSTHGMQSRGDHYGRGRFKTQEAEGWQKKPTVPEPTAVVLAVHSETSILHLHDHHGSTEATGNLGSHSHGKLEGQSVSPMSEQSDNHAQVYILICMPPSFSTSEIYMVHLGLSTSELRLRS